MTTKHLPHLKHRLGAAAAHAAEVVARYSDRPQPSDDDCVDAKAADSSPHRSLPEVDAAARSVEALSEYAGTAIAAPVSAAIDDLATVALARFHENMALDAALNREARRTDSLDQQLSWAKTGQANAEDLVTQHASLLEEADELGLLALEQAAYIEALEDKVRGTSRGSARKTINRWITNARNAARAAAQEQARQPVTFTAARIEVTMYPADSETAKTMRFAADEDAKGDPELTVDARIQ